MKTGRFISELRRSNAAGLHIKRSSDRYNKNRRVIEMEVQMSVLDDLDGPTEADLAEIEADFPDLDDDYAPESDRLVRYDDEDAYELEAEY